ncbi:MAG: 2OG-Fe(II) oxygenase [Gammaproteobacteria bacterium]
MDLRDSVLVVPGALEAEELAAFAAYAATAQRRDSLVSRHGDGAADELAWVLDRQVRDTQEIELSVPIRAGLDRCHERNVRRHIEPFFDVGIRDWEAFQWLRYGTGGHYVPHVDAESPLRDEDEREFWEKSLDRDLSVVYFLTDDFTGGELVFPALSLSLRPAAGTLVCFPADHHFLHGVQPVTAGERHTLVTWMRVSGMPTPEEINALNIEAFTLAWPGPWDAPPRIVRRAT